ncbi:DUF1080 domain-containing protein [Aeoliella sp. ICT_H6.2]|uniref:non-reducing end alpha-L-arabinofuranosidase n=1 Tax=Aeoliella straminimaris TaxID=2954799 RepID=A0A9X2FCE6_9BACT|nr:DUF1080 domain-containing protein [Aeoliella straminimaris]
MSDRLIGVFFEDINFGADGGLNAELVKNGSFELPPYRLGWKAIGQAELSAGRDAPASSGNPTFLRIKGPADGEAGVSNEGFRGMGLKEGEKYAFSMLARTTAGRSVPVTVRLVSEGGETLAEAEATVKGSAWKPVTADLVPAKTDAKAHLDVLIQSEGPLDIDLVSLYPHDTWQGRPHGLRKDLVQKLADLKPAFFRFPGGCIVEGSELRYRYQWKSTIGPRTERRPLVNRWNTEFQHRLTPDYYQSFDVGFYEYFQLAEDLGAEPLPILNCGMACQFNSSELVPMDELDPYIQDALDLIEFANGPVDSQWGAIRAAMGHPEPFGMKLLGVGNEQWGPDYFERYERFAQVLQQAHPEIELISTSGPFPSGKHFDYAWPILKQIGVPIVDEHCYAMPDWFLREASRYDNYDRSGPQVFMGEYAAQSVAICSPNNRNNLRCAVAEAAFLTGIERNSDVVVMSAYAPLMAHVDAWQWTPDLIWFDNLSSYATPNYYVQQLFSLHRGDVVLPLEIDDPRGSRQPGGRIGIGTFDTAADFRDVTVTRGDRLLLKATDLPAAEALTIEGGEWTTDDGTLHQQTARGDSQALFGDTDWGDCTIRLKVRKQDQQGGIRIFFRHSPGGSHMEWIIGGGGNKDHTLMAHMATHVETPQVVAQVANSLSAGEWHDVRVELKGPQIRCYLDGELVHDTQVPAPATEHLYASASLVEDSGEAIVKVVNPTDAPANVELVLAGMDQGKKQCRVITLSGAPEATNSIETPQAISPKESEVEAAGNKIEYEFPANSLTVFRVHSK